MPFEAFSNLPPAYFTPSTPIHLPYLFRKHGGTTLPSDPNDSDTDPLTLPVSYYFVNGPQDQAIGHLINRPLVLYDAAWVMECVLGDKALSLTGWIVDVDIWGKGSSVDSSISNSKSRSLALKTIPKPMTPLQDEYEFFSDESPSPVRTVRKEGKPPASAKYIIDFSQKTKLNVNNGMVSRFKFPLGCASENRRSSSSGIEKVCILPCVKLETDLRSHLFVFLNSP
jgi:hypothetical protein